MSNKKDETLIFLRLYKQSPIHVSYPKCYLTAVVKTARKESYRNCYWSDTHEAVISDGTVVNANEGPASIAVLSGSSLRSDRVINQPATV